MAIQLTARVQHCQIMASIDGISNTATDRLYTVHSSLEAMGRALKWHSACICTIVAATGLTEHSTLTGLLEELVKYLCDSTRREDSQLGGIFQAWVLYVTLYLVLMGIRARLLVYWHGTRKLIDKITRKTKKLRFLIDSNPSGIRTENRVHHCWLKIAIFQVAVGTKLQSGTGL